MTITFNAEHWPTEIRLKQEEKALEVDFDDGRQFRFTAELLRVESPSAEVQGHAPGQKKVVSGKRSVGIKKVNAVGNYAVQIDFDDGHDTGIFSWAYLYEMGENQEQLWNEYLEALKTNGLSRD